MNTSLSDAAVPQEFDFEIRTVLEHLEKLQGQREYYSQLVKLFFQLDSRFTAMVQAGKRFPKKKWFIKTFSGFGSGEKIYSWFQIVRRLKTHLPQETISNSFTTQYETWLNVKPKSKQADIEATAKTLLDSGSPQTCPTCGQQVPVHLADRGLKRKCSSRTTSGKRVDTLRDSSRVANETSPEAGVQPAAAATAPLTPRSNDHESPDSPDAPLAPDLPEAPLAPDSPESLGSAPDLPEAPIAPDSPESLGPTQSPAQGSGPASLISGGRRPATSTSKHLQRLMALRDRL